MASLRRLAADHAALHKAELPPYYLFSDPNSVGIPDDLSQLHILLAGPPGTPYADGVWKLNLRIPLDYPSSPPKAFFKTKIWHPNVDESTGSVCLDTLKRDWQSKLTLRDILITISCLLINPNPDSALNPAAGQLLQENWSSFARQAKLMTSIHARVPRKLDHAVRVARSRGDQEDATEEGADCSSDDEAYDLDDEGKENDPAMALVEVRPADTTRRTVLGKRPLAELPVPTESDENAQNDRRASARNIVANTPNLSTHMASFSIKSASASNSASADTSCESRVLVARPVQHGMSTDHVRDDYAEALWNAADSCETFEPASKRVKAASSNATFSDLGFFVETQTQKPLSDAQIETSSIAGLGLAMDVAQYTQPLLQRRAGMAGATGSKMKPRIGLRRL